MLMGAITGDGPDGTVDSGTTYQPALNEGIERFALHVASDLYGRGLLTSEQTTEVAQYLGGKLARLPVKVPPVVTNVEGAIVYRGDDGTLFVVDPNLELPERLAKGEPLCDLRYDYERGHFYDLAFANERIDPMSERGEGFLDLDVSDESGVADPPPTFGRFPETGSLQARIRMQDATIERILSPAEQVALKPGWKTTEGAIVILSGLGLFIATVFNWVTPQQAGSASDHLSAFLSNIGPLMIYLPLVWHFVTSRGKIKSNALRADAEKEATVPQPQPVTTQGLTDESEQWAITYEQVIRGFEAHGKRLKRLEMAVYDMESRADVGGAGIGARPTPPSPRASGR
jgi:hypothetical protein